MILTRLNIDFYAMAQSLLGELPETSAYLYDITTIILIILALFIMFLPLAMIFKVGRNL